VHDLIPVIEAFAALRSVNDIYLVLDALDECPKTGPEDQRAELLEALNAIRHILHSNIHLLVTSRQEIDIKESITPHLTVPALSIQDAGIMDDIKKYIKSQLISDLKLKSWSEDVKHSIECALTEGAGGMYETHLHAEN
jgi:hypothetical protein